MQAISAIWKTEGGRGKEGYYTVDVPSSYHEYCVRVIWRADSHITERCTILWPLFGILCTREKSCE